MNSENQKLKAKLLTILIVLIALCGVGCSAPNIKRGNNPSVKIYCKEHRGVECDDAYEWAEH